jgi:hypothetical protein
MSWAGRDDVNEEQLRQLIKTAPNQARRLLETEGYFSANAKARIEREQPEWVVKLLIENSESRVQSTGILTANNESRRRERHLFSQRVRCSGNATGPLARKARHTVCIESSTRPLGS